MTLSKYAVVRFSGEIVSTTAFVLVQTHLPTYEGAYFRLVDGGSEAEKAAMFKAALR